MTFTEGPCKRLHLHEGFSRLGNGWHCKDEGEQHAHQQAGNVRCLGAIRQIAPSYTVQRILTSLSNPTGPPHYSYVMWAESGLPWV